MCPLGNVENCLTDLVESGMIVGKHLMEIELRDGKMKQFKGVLEIIR